jgi:hypothetical protein
MSTLSIFKSGVFSGHFYVNDAFLPVLFPYFEGHMFIAYS